MIMGITGGFLGRYSEAAFHNQVRHYEILEDRDLWFLQLDFTQDQRAALNRHVSENSSHFYPYLFFTKNCAYYIQEVLSRVINDVPAPSGPTSPVGVMELISDLGVANACYFRPSLSRHLRAESRKITSATLATLCDSDWPELASDQEWITGLTSSERGVVQQYIYYKSLRSKAPPDSSSLKGIELMRVLNALDSKLVDANVDKDNLGEERAFPAFHSYTKVIVSAESHGESDIRIGVGLRPAIHDMEDPWVGFRKLNTLQMMSVDLSRSLHDADLRLERLTLYSQRALIPVSLVVNDPSWCLELQAERKGVFGSDKLNWVTRGGYGRTWEPVSGSFFYALLSGAVVWASDETVSLAPGIIAGAALVGARSWRAGVDGIFEADLLSGSRIASSADLWLRWDLGNTLGTSVFLGYGENEPRYGIKFAIYP